MCSELMAPRASSIDLPFIAASIEGMRWAVSEEVLGTQSFRLDWLVYAIRNQAAVKIAEAGSGCTPLDVQIMCGGEILLGHTLIQDVDVGPQAEVAVVRVNKIVLQGAGY